jgi:hypothetical protein
MGFFSSLGKFFSSKEEKKVVNQQPSVEHLVGVRFDKPATPPIVTLQSITKSPEKTDNGKPKTVYNKEQGELSMGERYLVVLDTTNRPEVKDRGLQGGLKNFYIVCAQNADDAKTLAASSFRHRPDILHQIQWCFTATPLSSITKIIDDKHNFWSYIPLRKGERAPGQQGAPPFQRTNPNNPEEIIPMDPRDIPAPVTPALQNDTPKPSEIPDEAKAPAANPMAAMMSPTLPNGQPNPMFAMMQMMMAAMGNGQAPVQPAQPQVTVRVGDPNSDPELAQRMAEVRATAVPQHKHHDPSAIDDAMEEADRNAQRQVEQFKRLPAEQRAASTLKKVDMNDVGVDMGRMKEIMEASSLNKGQ